jgi:hypothetical protein
MILCSWIGVTRSCASPTVAGSKKSGTRGSDSLREIDFAAFHTYAELGKGFVESSW